MPDVPQQKHPKHHWILAASAVNEEAKDYGFREVESFHHALRGQSFALAKEILSRRGRRDISIAFELQGLEKSCQCLLYCSSRTDVPSSLIPISLGVLLTNIFPAANPRCSSDLDRSGGWMEARIFLTS